MLTFEEQRKAQRLYCRWFAKNPKSKNPTDVNNRAKYEFAMQIGWVSLALMLQARKSNTKVNGYPYPWTKPEYWVDYPNNGVVAPKREVQA